MGRSRPCFRSRDTMVVFVATSDFRRNEWVADKYEWIRRDWDMDGFEACCIHFTTGDK